MKQQGMPRHIETDVPCMTCGYNLRTLPVEGRCPECGRLVQASVLDAARRQTIPWRNDRPFIIGMRTAIILHGLWFALLLAIGLLAGHRQGSRSFVLSVSAVAVMWVVSFWSSWWLVNGATDGGWPRLVARISIITAMLPPFLASILPISGPMSQGAWMPWLQDVGLLSSSLMTMVLGALLCRKLLSLRLEWLAVGTGFAFTVNSISIILLRGAFRRTRSIDSVELALALPNGLAGHGGIYLHFPRVTEVDELALHTAVAAPTLILMVITAVAFRRLPADDGVRR